MLTINDMYKNAKQRNVKLLSNYPADFWQSYLSNSAKYDKLFRRLYFSFAYFLQESGADIESVTDDFIDEVYNHLLINDKKYSELFRLHVVPDEDYDFTTNYGMREVMDKDTTASGIDNFGAENSNTTSVIGSRNDSASTNTGAQSNGSTNKVSPYDTETFYNETSSSQSLGSREDTSSKTVGQQTITDNTSQDPHTDNHSATATEDYILTRTGNIGTVSNTELLAQHEKFWSVYEFYQMIFRDIAKELLLVGDAEFRRLNYEVGMNNIETQLREINGKVDELLDGGVVVDLSEVTQAIDTSTTRIVGEVIQVTTDIIEHEDSLYESTVEAFETVGIKIDELEEKVDDNTADIITAINGVVTNEY